MPVSECQIQVHTKNPVFSSFPFILTSAACLPQTEANVRIGSQARVPAKRITSPKRIGAESMSDRFRSEVMNMIEILILARNRRENRPPLLLITRPAKVFNSGSGPGEAFGGDLL
jgi:hypothetical protein